MSRLAMSLLASVVLVGTAHADTFGGWEYQPPPGYTTQVHPDHVSLTKETGSTFCSIALFEARALEGSVAKETAWEWHNTVTHAFTAKITRRARMQTKAGLGVSAITAALVARDGSEYAAVHYAVMPPGVIGSVLLISSSPASLRECEPVATRLVSTLAIDWSAPQFTDPEARVETPIGRWAATGPTSREYAFAADGTYRFHSEAVLAGGYRITDELGTYAFVGNQLTLTPSKARSALVTAGVPRDLEMGLEKTTYTWGKRYSPDTNEWTLVLTPKRATKRDGSLSRAGYRYSDLVKPAWKFVAGPGA